MSPFFKNFLKETFQHSNNQNTTTTSRNNSSSNLEEDNNQPLSIAQIIDILAYEYGWTVDDILSLTKESIKLIVDAIIYRRKKEKEIIENSTNSNNKNFSKETKEKYNIFNPETEMLLLNEGIFSVEKI